MTRVVLPANVELVFDEEWYFVDHGPPMRLSDDYSSEQKALEAWLKGEVQFTDAEDQVIGGPEELKAWLKG